MNANKCALFDMDGSLADYDSAMRTSLRALRAPCEPAISNTDDLHALERAHPHLEDRMNLIKAVPGWWRTLPRIEAGFEIVSMAARIGFRLGILSKGPGSHTHAWMEKLDWIHAQPELDNCDVTITSDKSNSYGLFLYDDFPPYMDKWLANRPRGLGIMPATSYNAAYSHPRVIRWDGTNLAQIEATLRSVYAREPREPLTIAGR